MRNIMTSSEYMQMKENITQKIEENNVGAAEAATIVEKNLPKAEDYQSKLAKLIPAEVVGVYIFINGILPASTGVDKYLILRWIIFGVLFIINPFYLRYASAVTNKKQIVITTIGFAVWAFSLGGSLMVIGSDADFSRLVGSIILALYTLVVPMFITETPA
ncbi:MAG: hypothetical protein NTY07_04100 [Bacteroidia bacterium]|nr:hypothetical protein [Bacteroidia bacterium]